MRYTELLLGCGSRHVKDIFLPGKKEWSDLVTCDINPAHKPDVVWDLMDIPYPFMGNTFDEIHAYEVLEHTGQQGDYRFFFAQWMEFYRIIKPNGYFFASVPMWNTVWAYGDPSHSRVITKESLIFLDQENYTQIGNTSMTDFRYLYQGHFRLISFLEGEMKLTFTLQAIKD